MEDSIMAVDLDEEVVLEEEVSDDSVDSEAGLHEDDELGISTII